jgi:hypothetical protein
MERKEKRKVGTLIVYGKQVMCMRRAGGGMIRLKSFESLVLPETKKVAMLVG